MRNKLKGYRVMAGYTQEDVAKMLGVSRVMYMYIENGTRTLTNDYELKVFKMLKAKIPNLKREDVFPVLDD